MYIRSDRLIVLFDPPNQGWANNNRFDRTGAAVDILLDGRYTFATPETYDYRKPTTGGMGLMAEFQCQDFVDAAKAGERFHKAGVGMLERAADQPNPFNTVGVGCVPYEAGCDRDGDDALIFTSSAPMLHGYAFDISRRASVRGNRLTMTATMSNRGDKPFSLLEYNHNFVNLDDRPVGPEYRVDLTYDIEPDRPPAGALRREGRVYTFAERPQGAFFVTAGGIGDADAYGFTMSHASDALRVSERVSEKPARTAMWGTHHIVSVEVFLPVSLKPGESKTWTREWTFDAE